VSKKGFIEYSKKVEKLDSDVENLKSSFDGFASRIENTISELFKNLNNHQKETAPKPLSVGMIAAIVAILGGMFATVIYISNSSTAPLMAQQHQLQSTMNAILSNQTKLNSDIQLANKDISVIKNKANDNSETLNYLMYEIKLLPTITEIQKDIEYLQKNQGVNQ